MPMWLVTALLGLIAASGITKFFIEPWWMERAARRQCVSSVWLAYSELRSHLEEGYSTVCKNDTRAIETRYALRKIPSWDFDNNPEWFVKEGYFCMITAYKFAAFSSWMRIYQHDLMSSSFSKSRAFMYGLYKGFESFKLAVSDNTVLWYYYFDAIGDKLVEVPMGSRIR